MELVLYRTYGQEGTNGDLYIDGVFICHTIELPWLDNEPRRSCIPEGKYKLRKRCSPKFEGHLLVSGVKNRSMILFHPANNAKKELRGCIAPVIHLKGFGQGTYSRLAMRMLMDLAEDGFTEGSVLLTIKRKDPFQSITGRSKTGLNKEQKTFDGPADSALNK